MQEPRKIDTTAETWRQISRWASDLRVELVESLIKTDREDPNSDKLRGKIRLIDELLDLPDQILDEND